MTFKLTGGDYDGLKAGSVRVHARDEDPVMRYSLQEVGPVNEDAGTVRVTVLAVTNEAGVPRINYPVRVVSKEDTASAGSDYAEVDETLWFAVDDFEEFENNSGQTRYRQTAYLDIGILEDISAEGTESFELILNSLPNYRWPAYGVRRIEVPIIDNDTAGVTVTPTELTVAEGSSNTYTVVLDTQPAGDVTVTIEGVAGTDLTLDKITLTFTAQDWNTPQTVTVTAGQDHDAVDDTAALTHAVTSVDDANYNGLNVRSVDVTITDDDRVRVTVSETSLDIEEGGSDTYTVVLDTQPTGDVTVTIDGVAGTDLTLDKTTLTFTAQDWNTPQTVAVTSVQDHDGVDDTVALAHTVTSVDDANYNGLSVRSVDVTVTDDDTVGVTVSETSLTMEEGGLDTYTVVLDTQPIGDVTVTIDGVAGTDLSLDKTTLTFTAQDWNTPQAVTVTAGQDHDAVDDTATLTHAVSSANDTDYNGLSADVVVTVADDDTAGVTVIPRVYLAVPEGGTAKYTVVLDTEPAGDVTVTVSDPTDNTDVTADPASLTFTSQNWGTAQEVTVAAARDDNADDETATITHTVSSTGDSNYHGIAAANVEVTAKDDAPGSLTVNFGQDSYEVAESDATSTTQEEENKVTVTVTLDQDPKRTVTIPITATGQGGVSSSDYSGVPASVTFVSGDREEDITFTATDDSIDDDGESVKLGFGTLPGGVSAGITDETTVSINDDDAPSVTVSFGQSSYNVAEGGTVEVKVTLDADPERTVTIPLTATNQGGATDSDYSVVPASLTFGSNDTSKTVTFTAVQDDVDDDGESVKLGFGNTLPAGVSAGSPAETVVTITDDDVPSVEASFEKSSYSVEEGDDVTVTVKLDADPERTVTIPLTATNQDGATDSDYSGVPASVTFVSGDREEDITFTATDDSIDDDGESVKLGFGTLPGGVSAGTTPEATVSINDDDVPSVTVSFERSTYAVDEGGDVTVTVTLDADPERTVTIPLTATNQDGATSADYSVVPASLTFGSNDTSKTVTFTAVQDDVDDDGESVKLGFGNTLPDGVTAGTTPETTVSINDDDAPSVTVSFGQSSYSVDEGGTVEVKVTLSADPERDVTVPLTATPQGGASSSDYSGVPTSVTFVPGDTEETITFAAIGDDVDDDDESVKLGFGTLPAGVTEGTANEATVSITDDDDPSVTVSFESATYTVAEGGTVEVTVTLSADPERRVTVPLTATNQGETTDSDYSDVPADLTFNRGETEKSFTVQAAEDNLEDSGESVKLGFGSPLPTGVSAGSNDEATVFITNVSPQSSLTINFGASGYDLAEGDTTMVTVTLSTAPGSEVTIPLTTTEQGGATSGDYSGVPASLKFGGSDTSKTIPFTATDDTVDDDDESVKLTFGVLPAGVSAGSTDETTVSITDDDVPSVEVSFEKSSYTVAEGGNVTVKVKLSADPERTVTIPLTATGQDGATDSDYSGVPADLTFNSGDTEKSITFSAVTDGDNDDGENVKLTFGTLPTGVSAGTTAEATVSITGRRRCAGFRPRRRLSGLDVLRQRHRNRSGRLPRRRCDGHYLHPGVL